MVILTDEDAAILQDLKSRVFGMGGGPGIRVKNDRAGITISAINDSPPVIAQTRRGADVFKITSAAAGGGFYNGRSVTGGSTATGAGTLAMPEGMTVAAADDALILNADENGQNTHLLKVDGTCFVTGEVIGATAGGLKIVLLESVQGATASPTTLGGASEGSETADAAGWSRATTGTPVDVWVLSRAVYNDAGDEVLYQMFRKMSYDASGRLLAVSAETRGTVDAPDGC